VETGDGLVPLGAIGQAKNTADLARRAHHAARDAAIVPPGAGEIDAPKRHALRVASQARAAARHEAVPEFPGQDHSKPSVFRTGFQNVPFMFCRMEDRGAA
jgi:hypothetical protein